MIQEVYEQSEENKRMITEILRIVNKKASNLQPKLHYYKREDEVSEEEEEYLKEPDYPLRTLDDLNWVETTLGKYPLYSSKLVSNQTH